MDSTPSHGPVEAWADLKGHVRSYFVGSGMATVAHSGSPRRQNIDDQVHFNRRTMPRPSPCHFRAEAQHRNVAPRLGLPRQAGRGRSPGLDGGTMTTRSTPASSIIGTNRSIVKGSGKCRAVPVPTSSRPTLPSRDGPVTDGVRPVFNDRCARHQRLAHALAILRCGCILMPLVLERRGPKKG
jgi:hypothetical protein